jgi:hypothetical protein
VARVKKSQPTLDSIFFSTPEQKVMRLLLSEPTTSFTLRVIASKLKGIRGLGGVEGLTKILNGLQELGLVDFVDNHRAVRLHDDGAFLQLLKRMSAICDLETLKHQLQPVCSKGILFGSRASGRARSDSDYDLFVVSVSPDEAVKIAARHPLGKLIEIVAWTPEQFERIQSEDSGLQAKLSSGIVLWG